MPAAPPVTRATRPSSVPLVLARVSCVSVIVSLPLLHLIRVDPSTLRPAAGRYKRTKVPRHRAVGQFLTRAAGAQASKVSRMPPDFPFRGRSRKRAVLPVSSAANTDGTGPGQAVFFQPTADWAA